MMSTNEGIQSRQQSFDEGGSSELFSKDQKVSFSCAGVLYQCKPGSSTAGWEPMSEGYVPFNIVHCASNTEWPFSIRSTNPIDGSPFLFKIVSDTRARLTKATFLQWHIKGSRANYGLQLMNEEQAGNLHRVINKAIELAKRSAEAKPVASLDSVQEHRLAHLNRTGQTVEAFQLLNGTSTDAKVESQLMIRVHLPDNQSTMVRISSESSLESLLVHICEKRNLQTSSHALGSKDGKMFDSAQLKSTTVGSLPEREVCLASLLSLVGAGGKSKSNKADEMKMLATTATTGKELDVGKGEVFIAVILPDGSRTVIRLQKNTSMGEMLFHICEKRGLNVGEVEMAASSNGKKLLSVKGTVDQNNVKEVFVVMRKPNTNKSRKNPKTPIRAQTLSQRPGSIRKTQIGAPKLNDSSNHKLKEMASADIQRITSLLAEGVTMQDSRLPPVWKLLFERGGLTDAVLKNFSQRQRILDVVSSCDGAEAMVKLDPNIIAANFNRVFDFEKAKTVDASVVPPPIGVTDKAPRRTDFELDRSLSKPTLRKQSTKPESNDLRKPAPKPMRAAPAPPGAQPISNTLTSTPTTTTATETMEENAIVPPPRTSKDSFGPRLAIPGPPIVSVEEKPPPVPTPTARRPTVVAAQPRLPPKRQISASSTSAEITPPIAVTARPRAQPQPQPEARAPVVLPTPTPTAVVEITPTRAAPKPSMRHKPTPIPAPTPVIQPTPSTQPDTVAVNAVPTPTPMPAPSPRVKPRGGVNVFAGVLPQSGLAKLKPTPKPTDKVEEPEEVQEEVQEHVQQQDTPEASAVELIQNQDKESLDQIQQQIAESSGVKTETSSPKPTAPRPRRFSEIGTSDTSVAPQVREEVDDSVEDDELRQIQSKIANAVVQQVSPRPSSPCVSPRAPRASTGDHEAVVVVPVANARRTSSVLATAQTLTEKPISAKIEPTTTSEAEIKPVPQQPKLRETTSDDCAPPPPPPSKKRRNTSVTPATTTTSVLTPKKAKPQVKPLVEVVDPAVEELKSLQLKPIPVVAEVVPLAPVLEVMPVTSPEEAEDFSSLGAPPPPALDLPSATITSSTTDSVMIPPPLSFAEPANNTIATKNTTADITTTTTTFVPASVLAPAPMKAPTPLTPTINNLHQPAFDFEALPPPVDNNPVDDFDLLSLPPPVVDNDFDFDDLPPPPLPTYSPSAEVIAILSPPRNKSVDEFPLVVEPKANSVPKVSIPPPPPPPPIATDSGTPTGKANFGNKLSEAQMRLKTTSTRPRAQSMDGRSALLASLGTMGKGRLSLRQVPEANKPRNRSATMGANSTVHNALSQALDRRRSAMHDARDSVADTDVNDDEWDEQTIDEEDC